MQFQFLPLFAARVRLYRNFAATALLFIGTLALAEENKANLNNMFSVTGECQMLVFADERRPCRQVMINTEYDNHVQDITSQEIIEYICGVTQLTNDAICVDWVVVGSTVQIAAVEKQTLMEAGEFGKRHGFVTNVFTSYVQTGQFQRQPVFHDSNTLKIPSFMQR